MKRFFSKLKLFLTDNKAVTAIEYALIAVAMSSVLFVVLGTGGDQGLTSRIKGVFNSISSGLNVSNQNASQNLSGGGQ